MYRAIVFQILWRICKRIPGAFWLPAWHKGLMYLFSLHRVPEGDYLVVS